MNWATGSGGFAYGPPPQPVFISYSGDDSTVAAKVCRLLELEGIDCWIAPRNVEPGRDYGQQIITAIESAPAMVLIHSASANGSIFVPNELERAVAKGKPVFVLRLDQIQPSWDIGRLAARSQWFDAWTPPLEDRVYEMAAAIRRMLGMPPIAVRTARPGSRSGRPSVGTRVAAIGLVAVAGVALVGGLLLFTARGPEPTASPNRSAVAASTSALPSLLASPTPRLATGPNGFSYTSGFMETARGQQTATLLPDGRVLIAGGWDGKEPVKSAELYDPATDTFVPTGEMTKARHLQSATLLPDGLVLMVGGDDGTAVLSSAELYDSKTGSFSPTGSMTLAREAHTATLLPDGRVLIAGGWDGEQARQTAELYDPKTGKFSQTAPMTTGRRWHTATLLRNGKVLLVGGDQGAAALKTAELFDPKSGTFTATSPMSVSRSAPTATELPDGHVLIAGGVDGATTLVAMKSAEEYDPGTGAFTPTGSMTVARAFQTATKLRDGRVLIAGGVDSGPSVLDSAELYDPASGKFGTAPSMKVALTFQTATLLPDGRVLLAGGMDNNLASTAASELYQP